MTGANRCGNGATSTGNMDSSLHKPISQWSWWAWEADRQQSAWKLLQAWLWASCGRVQMSQQRLCQLYIQEGEQCLLLPHTPCSPPFLFFLPSSSRRCHGLMSLSQKSLGQQTGPYPDGNFCGSWKGHCPRSLIFRPLPAFPTCLFCKDSRKAVSQGIRSHKDSCSNGLN